MRINFDLNYNQKRHNAESHLSDTINSTYSLLNIKYSLRLTCHFAVTGTKLKGSIVILYYIWVTLTLKS